jgi:hypothetical protein
VNLLSVVDEVPPTIEVGGTAWVLTWASVLLGGKHTVTVISSLLGILKYTVNAEMDSWSKVLQVKTSGSKSGHCLRTFSQWL